MKRRRRYLLRFLKPKMLAASSFSLTVDEMESAIYEKPPEISHWDWANFLLHTAAEIEHSLMVQYLYSAFSLNDRVSGPTVPSGANDKLRNWKRNILKIARDEMAHLMNVQNILCLIGGPLNFEREDFPFREQLYPFKMQLEPFSRKSIAKYVAAEMPANPPDPHKIIEKILADAESATTSGIINRVGILYNTIIKLFKDKEKLPDTIFFPESANTFQAESVCWGIGVKIFQVSNRDDALQSLDFIAKEGEGASLPEPDDPIGESHFKLFYDIYHDISQTNAGETWQPAKPVPQNPNTFDPKQSDPGTITNPIARLWAQLFNVRYRLLLTGLFHYLHCDSSDFQAQKDRTYLRCWSLREMIDQTKVGGLGKISEKLNSYPLKKADSTEAKVAAPAFELPLYAISLPNNSKAQWRLHRATVESSQYLIGKIEETVVDAGSQRLLDFYKELDKEIEEYAKQRMEGPSSTLPPNRLSFQHDIRPLFSDAEINCMRRFFDLSKYEDVKKYSCHIYQAIRTKRMPPGGWPDEKINKFKRWIDDGLLE